MEWIRKASGLLTVDTAPPSCRGERRWIHQVDGLTLLGYDNGEDGANSRLLNGESECFTKVNAQTLIESKNDPPCLVVFETSIGS